MQNFTPFKIRPLEQRVKICIYSEKWNDSQKWSLYKYIIFMELVFMV